MNINNISGSANLLGGTVNINNNFNGEKVSADEMANIFGGEVETTNNEENAINQELEVLEQSESPMDFLNNLLSSENIMNKLTECLQNLLEDVPADETLDSETEIETDDIEIDDIETDDIETDDVKEDDDVQTDDVQTDDNTVKQQESITKKADVDGKIDDNEQGSYGDCWLLSGVNSLTTNESGKEVIDKMITDNKDGTYTVDLDGVNKSYTYSADEINKAQDSDKYASGDGDVVAIEMAVQECREDAVNGNDKSLAEYADFVESVNNVSPNTDALDYGGSCQEFYQLAGLDSEIYTKSGSNFEQKVDKVLDNVENNPESYNATMTFINSSNGNKLTDVNGNKVKVTDSGAAHVWSVKSVDNDNVTMVNPWDSSKGVTFKRSELLKNLADISYAKTSD